MFDKVSSELELLSQFVGNAENKKEEPKMIGVYYDKATKLWKEEGAVFRQATNEQVKKERVRLNTHLEKLAKLNGSAQGSRFLFKDRELFVKLLRNMEKGGYQLAHKNDNSITLSKHWYSFGMRSVNIHNLTFKKVADGYEIQSRRDRKQMNDYKKTMRYGWKMTPIRNVNLQLKRRM